MASNSILVVRLCKSKSGPALTQLVPSKSCRDRGGRGSTRWCRRQRCAAASLSHGVLEWFEGVDDVAEIWPLCWLFPGAPDQVRNGCMHCIWNLEPPVLISHRTHHLDTRRVRRLRFGGTLEGTYLYFCCKRLTPQHWLMFSKVSP